MKMSEGEQDGGLQQRTDREGGQETESVQCVCFFADTDQIS